MLGTKKLKRKHIGITLPEQIVRRLDSIRRMDSADKELAGRDRSAVIEIVLKRGMKAGR